MTTVPLFSTERWTKIVSGWGWAFQTFLRRRAVPRWFGEALRSVLPVLFYLLVSWLIGLLVFLWVGFLACWFRFGLVCFFDCFQVWAETKKETWICDLCECTFWTFEWTMTIWHVCPMHSTDLSIAKRWNSVVCINVSHVCWPYVGVYSSNRTPFKPNSEALSVVPNRRYDPISDSTTGQYFLSLSFLIETKHFSVDPRILPRKDLTTHKSQRKRREKHKKTKNNNEKHQTK